MGPFIVTILSKQVFEKIEDEDDEIRPLMIIVVVTRYGKLVELKSTNPRKIAAVYRRFEEGEVVQVESNSDSFQPVDSEFSDAFGELYSWTIHEVDRDLFTLYRIMHCHVSIRHYQMNNNKPASVAGLYLSFKKGVHTQKFDLDGDLVAQGYFVRLMDITGLVFQVLVWRNVNYDHKDYPLFKCNRNSVVVILFAREQEARYDDVTPPGYYTITSTYPPVIDPKCFSRQSRERLLELRDELAYSDLQVYNPYGGAGSYGDTHAFCGLAIAM